MGYIIKKGTGGGGVGDATAANQNTQISQVITTNDFLSDVNTASVFKNQILNTSVFKTPANESILSLSNITVLSSTQVQGFTGANVVALAAAIQTFLQTGAYAIINISYADNGVSHSAIVTYNTT